jgi:hypothetical protein
MEVGRTECQLCTRRLEEARINEMKERLDQDNLKFQ